jgi:radical SAM protein with 4Fe4S-binding SPASM domain
MSDQGYVVKRSLGQHVLFRKKAPLLQHLDIELTERCNNACIHCCINLPEKDTQAAQRELSTEQWKDILRQAADLGALSVRFTGGEPLLRPDFGELYLFARRLGMKVILFTNARLITPELGELFARVPPLKKIEVSVYGMHPRSYEAVACTPGAYAEFRRGVDLLLAQQIPFVVKSALLPPNKADIEALESWAATLPGQTMQPGYAVFLDLRKRRDLPAKNQLIESLRFTPEEGIALAARRGAAYHSEMMRFCSQFIGPPGDQLFGCGAGESGCVDPYGIYHMCLSLRQPDSGYDLSQGSMYQALTEFFPARRTLRAANSAYLERCARCFLKGLCEQCPAKSWSENGTLDTPVEYLCQVAHAQARYLGLLVEGERAWEITDWSTRLESWQRKSASNYAE